MVEFTELVKHFAAANACFGADVEAYSQAIGEDFLSPVEAFAHYCRAGWDACPELFPFLDPGYYANQVQQVCQANLPPREVSPFEHYMTVGMQKGLSPTPFFDPQFVRLQGNQVSDIFGFLSRSDLTLDPHPLFCKRYYRSVYSDIVAANVDPFVHFIRVGWRERRIIHPFFRSAEYTRFGFTEHCDRAAFNRLFELAYNSSALSDGQQLFDAPLYLRALAASERIANPLRHFLTHGGSNGCAFALFDVAYYREQATEQPEAFNPYVEYLSDFSHRRAPCNLFDADFYRRSASVNPQFKGSLLEHFVQTGAIAGVRPHPRVTITTTPPSRHSGLRPVNAFHDASGQQIWLCEPATDGDVALQVEEASEIEPALAGNLLAACKLPKFSCPPDMYEKSLVAAAVRCARSNCMVVAETALEDAWISRLVSPAVPLVSCTRPWLTLLSVEPPSVRYWHAQYGCKNEWAVQLPAHPEDRVRFVAQVLVSSIPNRLVICTDRMGIALLKDHGIQLSATIAELVLLIDATSLGLGDDQFLSEFIATSHLDLQALMISDDRDLAIVTGAGIDPRGSRPFVIGV